MVEKKDYTPYLFKEEWEFILEAIDYYWQKQRMEPDETTRNKVFRFLKNSQSNEDE